MLSRMLLMLCVVLSSSVLAAPKEIIIIRHADKLDQEETGPALSAKGMMRSIKFAYYFLNKFGEPDYIFSADSKRPDGREVAIRSLQTVAPLANMLAIKHPDTGFEISHPYASVDYDDLAKELLENDDYNDATILVCWSHKRIPNLTKALGVTDYIEEWPRYDYDTVFVLQYDSYGAVRNFKILRNQFPVNVQDSWNVMRDRLFRR